jgi:hypothetical protein
VTDPIWPRPHWRDTGARALVLWFVFGELDTHFDISGPRYRTRGTPAGVEIVRSSNEAMRAWEGYPLGGTLGALFERENKMLFANARAMRDCIVLRGELDDPRDLDYLRDLVGTITALFDLGAVAVVDPQMLSMFDAGEWRRRFFASEAFMARNHVAILANDDARSPGRHWIHTRGMRKFARPDISIRNVPAEHMSHAGELADRFVDFEALGGLVPDGREIAVEGLSANMHARHAGSLDDPDFSNVHLALRWPD